MTSLNYVGERAIQFIASQYQTKRDYQLKINAKREEQIEKQKKNKPDRKTLTKQLKNRHTSYSYTKSSVSLCNKTPSLRRLNWYIKPNYHHKKHALCPRQVMLSTTSAIKLSLN